MTHFVELPGSEDICMLIDQVWSTCLGEESGPVPCELVTSNSSGQPMVWAEVGISGSWNGVLSLGVSQRAASHITTAMFRIPADHTADADVADAIGELGNIVAGNIKSCLPEPSALSLPRVIRQPTSGPVGRTHSDVCLTWHDEPVRITLTETIPQEKAGA